MSDKIEKWIDEALKTEPSFQLRGDFRDRVVGIIRKQERINQRKFYFWMILGILAICGMGFGTVQFFTPSLFEGLGSVSQVIPLAILTGVILALIQYLDRKLVKDKLITPHV